MKKDQSGNKSNN